MGIVINTKTEWEARALLTIFEHKGWEWWFGGRATDGPTDKNFWHQDKEKTCFEYKDEFQCMGIDYFTNDEVISFQEFLEIEFGTDASSKKEQENCNKYIQPIVSAQRGNIYKADIICCNCKNNNILFVPTGIKIDDYINNNKLKCNKCGCEIIYSHGK